MNTEKRAINWQNFAKYDFSSTLLLKYGLPKHRAIIGYSCNL